VSFGFQFWDAAGSPLYGSDDAGFTIIDLFSLGAGGFNKTWYVDPVLTSFILVSQSGMFFGQSGIKLWINNLRVKDNGVIKSWATEYQCSLSGLAADDSVIDGLGRRVVNITGTVIAPDVQIEKGGGFHASNVVCILYGR
jgi:hypothetical protein